MATTRQKTAAKRNIKKAVSVSAARRRKGVAPKRGKHPLSSQAERQIPSGISKIINALGFAPDGKVLVAGCSDGSIRLWDVVPQK